MKFRFLLPLILALAVMLTAQAAPDAAALKKEIDALKADQAALRKEVQELKSVLDPVLTQLIAKAGPLGKEVPLAGLPTMGNAKAEVTLIEYSDYQCPFCERYFLQTWPAIRKNYVDTGKIRYMFSNFPLDSIHPQAFKAHEAAACAGDQGKYWEMHIQLFSNQRALLPPQLEKYAANIGLNVGAYKSCVESSKYAAKVRHDFDAAANLGVEGTPTFVIGRAGTADSKMKAVKVLVGAQTFDTFKEAIDAVLSEPAAAALKDR
jgi:protein-disulfide isomerase